VSRRWLWICPLLFSWFRSRSLLPTDNPTSWSTRNRLKTPEDTIYIRHTTTTTTTIVIIIITQEADNERREELSGKLSQLILCELQWHYSGECLHVMAPYYLTDVGLCLHGVYAFSPTIKRLFPLLSFLLPHFPPSSPLPLLSFTTPSFHPRPSAKRPLETS